MIEVMMLLIAIAALGVTITYGVSVSGGGISIQPLAVQRTGSGPIGLDQTLAAAQGGSLTTRTNDTSGTITMTSGDHTIATADVVDVYWDGGVRYNVVVGTVSTTAVPISGGSGDNLPTEATAVTVVRTVTANLTIDGDEAHLIAFLLETNDKSLRTAGHIQFRDSAAAEVAEIDLVANVQRIYDLDGGDANPFTGNIITALRISQGGTSESENYRLKITGVQDATP